jgi:hypothetical protein
MRPVLRIAGRSESEAPMSHVLPIAWRDASLSYSGRFSGVLPIAPACLPSVLGAFALPAMDLSRCPVLSTTFRCAVRRTVPRLTYCVE